MKKIAKIDNIKSSINSLIEDFNTTVHEGEKEILDKVNQFAKDYTIEVIEHMRKEEYVYGLGRKDTFCYRITHELRNWGSIQNGSAIKYGIYFNKKRNAYQLSPKFGKDDTDEDIDKGFLKIKNAICDLLRDGQEANYDNIDNNPLSAMIKGKILCVYFPDKYINIYSESHLLFYLDLLEIKYKKTDGNMVKLNKIIDWKNSNKITKFWTNHEFSKFLYCGIGYPPEQGERKNIEDKADSQLNYEINKVRAQELPKYEQYIPKKEFKKAAFLSEGGIIYPRDKQISLKALCRAGYKCEIDNTHVGFIRKSNGTNYTEAHHLVPMSEQAHFDVSLDVQANIVSLCSNCHNMIHYGKDYKILLKKLYVERKEELEKAGIYISYEELIEFYR